MLSFNHSPSLSLSRLQAGSCHESLTALSVDKWLFKYGAIQRTLFNTHRCSFHNCHPMALFSFTVHKLPRVHAHADIQYTQLNTQHLLGSPTLAKAADVTQMFGWHLRLREGQRKTEELLVFLKFSIIKLLITPDVTLKGHNWSSESFSHEV